jgi:ribosomal-protein-alanine N-acetyltransferase
VLDEGWKQRAKHDGCDACREEVHEERSKNAESFDSGGSHVWDGNGLRQRAPAGAFRCGVYRNSFTPFADILVTGFDVGTMISEIPIREYRGSDLDALVALDEMCFEERFLFDRESMRAFAEEKGAIVLIAEADGGVAGFVIVHVGLTRRGRVGYVVTLDVAEEWRRRGLAGRLMGEGERRAVDAGARRMELDVYAGNAGAIRFYERMGYACVGMRRGFYGAGMDALVYRKELGSV